MKRWIELAAQLYPAKWRQRYGDEYRALLEDLHPGWREFFNVLGGAVKMQLLTGESIYLKLGAVFAVLGMVAALGVSLAVPRQYTSSAVFRVESALEQPLFSAIQQAASRTGLSEIITRKDLDLYHHERFQMPLEDVIAEMNHDLQIHQVRVRGGGIAVQVNFRYRDPRAAQAVVNTIVAKLTRNSNLTIVHPASLPTTPASHNLVMFLAVGMTVGMFLGCFIALSIRQPRPTLLVTGMGLAGCVLGAGFSLLVPNRYISTAVVRIVPVEKQAELLAHPKRGLNVQLIGPGKTAMEITFESTDPYKAQREVSAFVQQLIEANRAPTTLDLLDGASLPQSPNFPNRIVISAIGLASGLLLGALTLLEMRGRQTPALA